MQSMKILYRVSKFAKKSVLKRVFYLKLAIFFFTEFGTTIWHKSHLASIAERGAIAILFYLFIFCRKKLSKFIYCNNEKKTIFQQ